MVSQQLAVNLKVINMHKKSQVLEDYIARPQHIHRDRDKPPIELHNYGNPGKNLGLKIKPSHFLSVNVDSWAVQMRSLCTVSDNTTEHLSCGIMLSH